MTMSQKRYHSAAGAIIAGSTIVALTMMFCVILLLFFWHPCCCCARAATTSGAAGSSAPLITTPRAVPPNKHNSWHPLSNAPVAPVASSSHREIRTGPVARVAPTTPTEAISAEIDTETMLPPQDHWYAWSGTPLIVPVSASSSPAPSSTVAAPPINVPEPGSLALFAAGLPIVALLAIRRKS